MARCHAGQAIILGCSRSSSATSHRESPPLRIGLRKLKPERLGQRVSIACFTLPNGKHLPAGGDQRLALPKVSGDRARKLCLPEIGPRFGRSGAPAPVVPMPVTAVDEYDGVQPWKGDVRPAGQIAPLQPKPIS